MPESSTALGDSRERQLKLAAVVVSVLVVLYGVLIAGQILAPIVLVVCLFVVYLLWRFVRAHERLADAAERVAADQGGRETRPSHRSGSEPTDEDDSAEQ